MLNQFIDAFNAVDGKTDANQQWVQPYTAPANSGEHQFVLFVKPEATATRDGVNVSAVLELILEKLANFDVTIGAARVLPARYLETHSILDQHYGVINRISKLGVDAMTASAKARLEELYAAEIAAGTPVMGGHQFLESQNDINAFALSVINDNLGTTKLGGGCYALTLNLRGKNVIILNPFHAYQLVPYTTPGNAIIVLEGRSATAWADLRAKLTGSTNPANAAPGSIRESLLANKEKVGMRDVNMGMNGVHLSAGPLEGMVELKRFFTDHDANTGPAWSDLAFGQLLAENGFTAERIDELAGNVLVGDETSFDLTEEIDAAESVARLKG